MSENRNELSLSHIKCPRCGSNDFIPAGFKGFAGKAFAILFFGLITRLFLKPPESGTIVFRCKNCKKQFEGSPINAEENQILEKPCLIKYTRKSSFVGAAIKHFIYLNGQKTATVGNGGTVEFSSNIKENLIFSTDVSGAAFKYYFRFIANSGDNVEIANNQIIRKSSGEWVPQTENNISLNAPPLFCQKCGAKFEEGQEFCSKCHSPRFIDAKKKTGKRFAITSFVLGILAFFYSFMFIAAIISPNTDNKVMMGSSTPSFIIMFVLSMVFGLISFIKHRRKLALAGVILSAVPAILLIIAVIILFN